MGEPQRPQRINVVGTSGSGKSTLARQLAERLGYPCVELDALHWLPDWTACPLDQFRARVGEAAAPDRWVIDGNYSKVRDLIWPRADTVVWLNYSFPLMLWRIIKRTLRRAITREELWAGNRESWRLMFSRDSIILWMLTTYRKRRREYPQRFARPENAHLHVVELRSPREANRWLENIGSSD